MGEDKDIWIKVWFEFCLQRNKEKEKETKENNCKKKTKNTKQSDEKAKKFHHQLTNI